MRVALRVVTSVVSLAASAEVLQPQELEPGHLVVFGADRRPVPDASVTVLQPRRAGPLSTAAVLVRTETAKNGTTTSPLPRLRGLTLVVDHSTHLPFVGEYPSDTATGSVRLQPGRTAKGMVRESADGTALAGARVCATWRNAAFPEPLQTWRRCADSDEGGEFELAGLPATDVQVTADAPGFETGARAIKRGSAAWGVAFELVASQQTTDEAEDTSVSAGQVRVELVGAAGEQLRQFTMRTYAVGRMGGSTHLVKDAEGPTLVPLSRSYANESAVDVAFEAENYLRSSLIRVVPRPGGEVELGLVALDPGAVVQGRLFDAGSGRPVAGCLVELLSPGAGAIGAALMGKRHLTLSDPEGHYSLGGLEAGRYHLRQQCPGAPVADRLIVLRTNEFADVGEAWSTPGRRVAVRVAGLRAGTLRLLDRFREVETPLVEVPLRSFAGAGAERRDDEVRAEFLAAPGVYRVEVLDRSGRLRWSQETRIADGLAESQLVEFHLSSRVIRSVLVVDGQPVTGGTVALGPVFRASRSSAKLQMVERRTGATSQARVLGVGAPSIGAAVGVDGSFEVVGAPSELLWMTLYANDGTAMGRLWPDGGLPVMQLDGVRTTGQLLDADGAPVAGGASLVGAVGRTVAYAEVGADGRFELPPAPPGTYRLKAVAGYSLALAQQSGNKPAGSVSKEIVLTDEPPPHQFLHVSNAGTGVLRAELRHEHGRPAAGAWLHLVNATGDVVGGGLTSAAGAYANRAVPAGKVSLVWSDGDACVGGVGLAIEESGTTTLRESLSIGRLLELRCRPADCAGEPLSFLSVTTESGTEIASHLTGAGEGVRFSGSGRLGLGCVTPGSYEVSFWAASRRWAAQTTVGSKGVPEEPLVVNGREAGSY